MASLFKYMGLLTNYTPIRTLRLTQVCLAEPPRKKRRIDPALLKLRVERKIRKAEREINRIEREPRNPIPLLEMEFKPSEMRELKQRPNHEPMENPLMIKAAQKLWCMYRTRQNQLEQRSIKKVTEAQKQALETLKLIDRDLYDKTVAVDEFLVPYRSSHIRKETAPNPDYKPPDGYVKDITRNWVM